jgi:hypothetical protein
VWRITFRFAESGATRREVGAIRKILDEFRDTSIGEVWREFRSRSSFTLGRELGNLEMRCLVEAAKRVGLHVEIESIDRSSSIPISFDGSGLIIEDDDTAHLVAQKMIEAGVPIDEAHVD